MYASAFIRNYGPDPVPTAVVITPFGFKDGHDYDQTYETVVAPTIEEAGLKAQRLDKTFGETEMSKLIAEWLQKSTLVIVDVSNMNANVAFELAIAMVYGKRIVFINLKGSKIMSDLPNARRLEYSTEYIDTMEFKEALGQQIRATLQTPAEEMMLVPFQETLIRMSATVVEVRPELLLAKTAGGHTVVLTAENADYTRAKLDLTKRYKVGDQLDGGYLLDPTTMVNHYTLLKPEDNPWLQVASNYAVGTEFRGRVTNVTPHGVFVQVIGRLNGLVHTSSFPNGMPAIGDTLDVVVSRLDISARKIGLALKTPIESTTVRGARPSPTGGPSVGTRCDGVITRITPYNESGNGGGFVLVQLDGYERPALLHMTKLLPSTLADLERGDLEVDEILDVEVVDVAVGANGRLNVRVKEVLPVTAPRDPS